VPGTKYPDVEVRFADKYVHFLLYTPFGLLLGRWIGEYWYGIAAVLAGWFYGATDEIHQRWVPKRSCDIHDWMVDALAVIAGVMLFHLVRKRLAPSLSAHYLTQAVHNGPTVSH
jgi:VanZ family protein